MKQVSKLLASRRTPKGFIEESNFLDRLSEMRKMNSIRSHRYTADDKYFEAIKLGNADKVQKHIDYGYHSANYKDWKQRTLLHFTCAYGQLKILEILLQNNCDIDAFDKKFTTALSVAVQCGHTQCASLLLEHGANINIIDKSGKSPFHYAVCDGQQNMVELLLQHHADIEGKTIKHGLTPLLLALREKRVDMAQFLITKGANIFAVDNQKRNSLMYAVRCDSEAIVKLLLQKGVNIYYQDEFGWTALRYAIEGRCNVGEMLSEYTKTNREPIEDRNTVECKNSEEESVPRPSQTPTPGTILAASHTEECNSNTETISECESPENAGKYSEAAEEKDQNKVKLKMEEQLESSPVVKSVTEGKESIPNEAEARMVAQEFILEPEILPIVKPASEEIEAVPYKAEDKAEAQELTAETLRGKRVIDESETLPIIKSAFEEIESVPYKAEDRAEAQELIAEAKEDADMKSANEGTEPIPNETEEWTVAQELILESETLPIVKPASEEIEAVPYKAEDKAEAQELTAEAKEDLDMKSAVEEKISIPNEEMEITWVQPFIPDEVTETEKYVIESDLEIVSLEENMSDDSGHKQNISEYLPHQDVCDVAGATLERGELNISGQIKDEPPEKLILEEEQSRHRGSEHVQKEEEEASCLGQSQALSTQLRTGVQELQQADFTEEKVKRSRSSLQDREVTLSTEDIFRRPSPLQIGFVPMAKDERIVMKDYMKVTPDTHANCKETIENKDSASMEMSAMTEDKLLYTETSKYYAPCKVPSESTMTPLNEELFKEDVKSLCIDEKPVTLTTEQLQIRMGDIESQHVWCDRKGTPPLLKRPVAVATDLPELSVIMHREKDTPETYPQWKKCTEKENSASREASAMKDVKTLYCETSEFYAPCKKLVQVPSERNVTPSNEELTKEDVKSLCIDEQPVKLTSEQFQTRICDIQCQHGWLNGKGTSPLFMRRIAIATDLTGTKALNHRSKDTSEVDPQWKKSLESKDSVMHETTEAKNVKPLYTDNPDTHHQSEAIMDSEETLCKESSGKKYVKPCYTDSPDACCQEEVSKEQEQTLQREALARKDVWSHDTDSGISSSKQSFPNSNTTLLGQNCLQQVTERIANVEDHIIDLQKNVSETKEVTQELKKLLKKPEKVCSLCHAIKHVQVKKRNLICHHQNLEEQLYESEEQYKRKVVRKPETYLQTIDMKLLDLNQELNQKHSQTQRRTSTEEGQRTLPNQILEFCLHIRKHTDILQQKFMPELQVLDDEMASGVCHMKKMKHLSKNIKGQHSKIEDIIEKQAEKIKRLKSHLSMMSEELSQHASLMQATAEENWEESCEETQLEIRIKNMESKISKIKTDNDPNKSKLKHAMQLLVLELRLRQLLLHRLNLQNSMMAET